MKKLWLYRGSFWEGICSSNILGHQCREREDSIRLHHMLDAAKEAIFFVYGKTRSSLDTDRKLVFALIKCIEIVGEAAGEGL